MTPFALKMILKTYQPRNVFVQMCLPLTLNTETLQAPRGDPGIYY